MVACLKTNTVNTSDDEKASDDVKGGVT